MMDSFPQFSGCEQFELRSEDATIPCLKHASYWTIVAVGETPLSAVSSRAVQARVRSHGPVGTQVSSTGDQERDEYLTAKKEWDDRYRFFSRPFNLSNHACGAFESLRMRNCFDRSFSGDPLLTPQQLPVYRGRSMEKRLASCSELVELSRKRSAEKGSHTSGYKWPKYKFFSSGLQTPSSGLVDKFYRSA